MATTKLKLGLVGAILVAVVATPLVIQHHAKLLQQIEALQRQFEQLSSENTRLSNLVAQVDGTRQLGDAQLRDLLRLRSEVGLLRQQTNVLAKLQEEIYRLRTGSTNRNPQTTRPLADAASQNVFPKESWTFAGYATPEAALESAVWAMSQGDTKTFLASFSPDEQKRFVEKEWADKSESEVRADGKEQFSKVRGFQILDRKNVDDAQIDMAVYISGMTKEVATFRVQRIGGEWKLGPVSH
jgi:hypothetical protein